ncbi:MAG: D-alanyl-D-alanine carboxypeptidase family protein [Lachnospiraceae bacterium]|nr:D-alanyl-D-alanine carboxypeptidase family protein [Lachnospiraceae bacterium]
MKLKFLAIFLCLSISLGSVNVFGEPLSEAKQKGNLLQITADAAILIDATTGEILYEKNKDKKEYPASITKLMTMLLAMEYGKFDETIIFSEEAVFGIERNSSHIAIDVGEELSMNDAFYAIMLASANEVALGLAEHIDGSIEAFAEHMTKRAAELGCTNTHFVNSNGLHDENHYTTANDMALITKELIKYDKFREVAKTLYWEIPPTNLQTETRYLYAQHQMLKKQSLYYYEYALGGKTGFTNEAQNTLVTFAEKDGTTLIAVVLKEAGANAYIDSATLFNYGFENFKTVEAFNAQNFSDEIEITDIKDDEPINAGKAFISADENIYATVPADTLESDIKTEKSIENSSVPINAGDTVGSVKVYVADSLVGETVLRAKNSVLPVTSITETKEKETSGSSLLKVLKIIGVVFLILFALFIGLLVASEINFRKKIKKRRRYKYNIKYKNTRK